MRRGVGVVAAALLVTGCGDDREEQRSKDMRQGATVSIVGDAVVVVGGMRGPAEQLWFGDTSGWEPAADVTVVGLDGVETAAVDLDLGSDTIVMASAAAVDDRYVVVGGRCAFAGFGCGGPTGPLVAWVDADTGTAEVVDVGGTVDGGEARLLGVGGGAGWVVVDRYRDARIVRVDAASGAASAVEMAEPAWTADTCAGPDAVVTAVAELDGLIAQSIEFRIRSVGDDPTWAQGGFLPLDGYAVDIIRMRCLGDGLVLLDVGDPGRGPFVVATATGEIVAEAPDDVRGDGVQIAADPAGGLAVVWAMPQGVDVPVFAFRPGGAWEEIGTAHWSESAPPQLGVDGGRVFNVAGVATVVGARARELSFAR